MSAVFVLGVVSALFSRSVILVPFTAAGVALLQKREKNVFEVLCYLFIPSPQTLNVEIHMIPTALMDHALLNLARPQGRCFVFFPVLTTVACIAMEFDMGIMVHQ